MTTLEIAHASPSVAPIEKVSGTTSSPQRNESRELIGLVLFWLLTLAYAFFIPSIISWNAESHLYTSYAMVDHHTVQIDAYHFGLGDQSFARGHYYSDKAPGMAFLGAPIYAGIRLLLPNERAKGYGLYHHRQFYYFIPQDMIYVRYVITYFMLILPSAGLGMLLWLFLCRLTGSTGWALFLAVTYALGTVAYIYSVWLFSHQLDAVLLFSSFLLVFYGVRQRATDRKALLYAGLAGGLSGLAIITEYPTAVIAGAVGLYLLAVARNRIQVALVFGAGMVPSALLNVGYNLAAFGKPFATGYLYVHSSAFQSHVHGGFLGLANPFSYAVEAPTLNSIWQITFGGYRGIFLISPVLVLFFAGVVTMWRQRELRAEWWLCVGIVLVYFLMDASRGANTNGWSGGSSVASRHLTPMIPFMFVPIAYTLRMRAGRIAFTVLAAVSLALQCMIVWFTGLFPYNDQNPIFNEVLPNFAGGHVQTNWIDAWRDWLHLIGVPSLLPLVIPALAMIAYMVRLVRNVRAPLPADQPLVKGEAI